MMIRKWIYALSIMISIGGDALGALQVQELKTSQGITIWLASQEGPVVSVQIAFKGAGACTDPDKKMGRAETVSALSLEGAGGLDARALAARLEDLCSSITLFSNDDHMMCSIITLRKNMNATLKLARDILFKPRFESQSLEKVKKQALASLASVQGDPGYILQKACAQVSFGTHPYGRFPTEKSLSALTLEDMKDYKRFWGINNLVVVISGALTPEETIQLVENIFEGLPPHADTVLVKDVSVPLKKAVYSVDMDIPQSMIRFFQPGIRPQHQDFYAAVVLDHILGGGAIMSSRLIKEVRVKSGYAYSVGTSLVTQDHHVQWGGRAGSKNETALSAVSLIQKEWMRAAREGVTLQELDDVKRYLTGSWALNFKTSQEIAHQLMTLRLDGWDAHHVNERNTAIQNVSLHDVRRVAGEFLKPDHLTFVIVGRPQPDSSVTVKPLKLHNAL